MRVVCAWCEKEGKEGFIKDIDGPNDQISHGICGRHESEMLNELEHMVVSHSTNPRRRRSKRHRR